MIERPPRSFSAAERERRWDETRQRMARAGIAALAILPGWGPLGHLSANQRYLCNAGDQRSPAAAVFPVQGSPTLVLPAEAVAAAGQEPWTEDVRADGGGRHGAILAARLRELGLTDATIGVPYLDNGPNGAESPLAAGALAALRAELPRASFVDATTLLQEQRRVKSDEEVAAIAAACGIADHGIFLLGYQMRAGMAQREALSILEAAILRAGGDPGHAARWTCSPAPIGVPGSVQPLPLAWGDVIIADVAPRVGGYGGREAHALCVGKPPQRIYALFDLALKAFEAARPLLAAGHALDAALVPATEAATDAPSSITFDVADVGLADEPMHPGLAASRVLEANQVLAVQPIVRDVEGTTLSFCSTVAVTAEGGRRLARRPLELMLTSRSLLSAYTDWRTPEPTAPWLASRDPVPSPQAHPAPASGG